MRIRREGAGKPRKKVLAEIRIRPAENGGHIIEHHYDNSGPGEGYHDPESHVFGKDEGPKAHAHIQKHMAMPMQNPENEQAEETEESE